MRQDSGRGPGDTGAASICLGLAAGEEAQSRGSRTELALALAYWVAMRKSLGLSGPLYPFEKDRAVLDGFSRSFWFLGSLSCRCSLE